MKNPRFSIITVCYNAEKYINDTIQSVLMQSYNDLEYIIKDGCSEDTTMDIAHKLCDDHEAVIFIRNRDQGIYDAMNIALESARGEYIFFLNAGDKFADRDVLLETSEFINHHKADIYYGNVIEIGSKRRYLRKYTERNSKIWYYSLGACLCHQGMFCHRKLFQEKKFDISYKVCADREWQLYHISKGKKAIAMNYTLTEILEEGFSSEHVAELEGETEECIKLYCGRWYMIYMAVNWLKKSKIVHRILSEAEKMISCKDE